MRANSHLDVALESKRLTPSPYMHWVALVALWGQGVERNLQIVPWVIETWPPDTPRVSNHQKLRPDTSVISVRPIMSFLLLLQVDAEPPVEVK